MARVPNVAREFLPYFKHDVFYCCSIIRIKLVSGFHSLCTSILIQPTRVKCEIILRYLRDHGLVLRQLQIKSHPQNALI